MKYVSITPRGNCLLAELHERASFQLNSIISQTGWLKWSHVMDVNGKGRLQWYIVADTATDKDARLNSFAHILCVLEGYEPSCRICPHDSYYEDFEKYFLKYCK